MCESARGAGNELQMGGVGMISREQMKDILLYRVELLDKIKKLEAKLICDHEIGEIAFDQVKYSTEVECSKCRESYGMTYIEDGSCMSAQHMHEYNVRKKSKKETAQFGKYLNERIQERIKDAKEAFDGMLVINFHKRIFGKSRIEVLAFDKGGICVNVHGVMMSIVSPKTYYGNKRLFFDEQLSFRNGILSSDPDDEWEELV